MTKMSCLIALVLILTFLSPLLIRAFASPSLVFLTISTNYGTTSPAGNGEYETGTKISISATSPDSVPGERCTWLGWNGTGAGSYSGMNNLTTITLNGPTNETASWRHEYKLTVSAYVDNNLTSVGEYWYESGTQVNLTLSPPSAPNGERYVWGFWVGFTPGSYNGNNVTAPITMIGPVNETAAWVHQYQVVLGQSGVDVDHSTNLVTAEGGTYWNGASIWVNANDSLSFAFSSPLEAGAGKMYVWTSTSGLSKQQNGTVTILAPANITAYYKTRYYLDVVSPHETGGGTGWYDSGLTTYATLSQSIVNASQGVRYVFTDWSGDGSGSNFAKSDSILMNKTRIVTADYTTQFQVAVGQSGVGSDFTGTVATIDGTAYKNGASFWWDNSSSHVFDFPSQLEVNAGKRYAWSSTTGLSSLQTGTLITSASGTINANYKTQYYLDVVSPGGTSGGGAGWYDSGVTTYATLPQQIVNASAGVRYVFEGWGGDASGTALTSNPIALNGSKSAVALYHKQFQIVFNQTGSPSGLKVNLLVNSTSYSLPYSDWFDEGTIVQFAYQSPLSDSFGQQYVLDSTSITSPLTVESPTIVIANYVGQYTIEVYASIIVSIVVVLVVGIILLRRRKT